MKKLLVIKVLALGIVSLAMVSSVTSCKKTVEVVVHDTTVVPAADTMFAMVAPNWNSFNYVNQSLMVPGATTYTTTAEGVKFIGQAYRYGARLQTKNEIRITGKTIYYKWKLNSGGAFADVAPMLKYDPMTMDGAPTIQGVQLGYFSTPIVYNGSTLVQDNVWYYTRITSVAGTDNYTSRTATGNYDNQGGAVIQTRTINIPTKAGYISFALGDVYGGTSAYAVLGECKVASN